jgi:hypothetical protein
VVMAVVVLVEMVLKALKAGMARKVGMVLKVEMAAIPAMTLIMRALERLTMTGLRMLLLVPRIRTRWLLPLISPSRPRHALDCILVL